MKKMSNKQWMWRVKRQKKRFRRFRLSKISHKASYIANCKIAKRGDDVYSVIHMPRVITINNENDRSNTLSAIAEARRMAVGERRNVILDFSKTRHTIADGMLLLYAELFRLQRLVNGSVSIKCRLPEGSVKIKQRHVNVEANKVAQVLKHIGILDLLGNNANITPTRSDVVHWKVAHGIKSEGKKTEPLLKIIDELLGQTVSRRFYTGLTEAMTNSHHHAYADVRDDGMNISNDYGWWMFLQVKDNNLSILICDLGIGIPRSLPKTNKYWLIDMLKQLSDHRESAAIEYATQKGSTSTDMKNRGKGLKKMIGLVSEIPNSSLAIYSNKGAYFVEENRDRFIGAIRKDFADSILGTLVYWQVDLDPLEYKTANEIEAA